MNSINTLLIVGFGRAGKDEAGEYLGKISRLKYAGSTSWTAKEDVAAALGVHPQVAWETRHQNREAWKEICDDLRQYDQTGLIRRALRTGKIVTGVRDLKELVAARAEELFDCILWIERRGIPRDHTVTFSCGDCDEALVNDGSLLEFHATLAKWAAEKGILRPPPSPTEDLIRE